MRPSAALYTAHWLATLKSAQLQRIARATGIQSSGTKGVLIDRIATELPLQLQSPCVTCEPPRTSQDRHKSRSKRTATEKPWSVLSIDMGIQNLAFAHLVVPRTGLPKLTAWHRLAVSEISSLDLILKTGATASGDPVGDVIPITEIQKSKSKGKESFSPDLYAAHAYTLISSLLTAYRPTHVLIERQRFRSGGGSAVQEWTLRVGVLEGMLHAVLHTLRQERGGGMADLVVCGVEPKRVVGYWAESGLGSPSLMEEKVAEGDGKAKRPSAKEGKKAKINIVGGWLSATQDADVLSNMHGSGGLMAGISEKKIVLADQSESPVLHGVVGAYLRKWQGKRQMPKETRGKGGSAAKSISSRSLSSRVIGDDGGAVDLGKLDDLADCLLQGVTWVEWQIMRERIAKEGITALEPMLR